VAAHPPRPDADERRPAPPLPNPLPPSFPPGGSPVASRPLTGFRGAWLVVAVALAIASIVSAVLAWRADDLRREWLIGAALGTFLLGLTGLFDALLLSRSRQPFEVAHQALQVAADDLAVSYAALNAAHQDLQATAAARDRALTSLQAAVRERETFLASISHDLKTPLTLIKGHADLLYARVARSDNPELAKMVPGLGSITANSAQMAQLIDELLELARLQVGQSLELDRRSVDLVALARRVTEDHDRASYRHRIRFQSDVATSKGLWDAARLERVLDNLLSNAVKYSPHGGEIVVAVGHEPEPEPDGTATLRVSDHGLGIPAADLPRIFDRFHRGANVAQSIEGTGLGLAGVRHTVEGHGGSLTVESTEGEGSTFLVRLPPDGGPPETEAGPAVTADDGTPWGLAQGTDGSGIGERAPDPAG